MGYKAIMASRENETHPFRLQAAIRRFAETRKIGRILLKNSDLIEE
jgi:hypothetical protein